MTKRNVCMKFHEYLNQIDSLNETTKEEAFDLLVQFVDDYETFNKYKTPLIDAINKVSDILRDAMFENN